MIKSLFAFIIFVGGMAITDFGLFIIGISLRPIIGAELMILGVFILSAPIAWLLS